MKAQVQPHEGFNFREQLRSTPTIEDRAAHPVWNHDQLVRKNIIALNRAAQVWGWFDVKDNRHWATRNQSSGQEPPLGAAKPADLAAPYAGEGNRDQPHSLTLEKLRLRFENNVYFAAPDQGWFKWGTAWARHATYTSLNEFQADLGIDVGSRVLNPGFTDLLRLDMRLNSETMAMVGESYPRGPVPGAVLGLQ